MNQSNGRDSTLKDLSRSSSSPVPMDYTDIKDLAKRAKLQRIEERIYSYTDDVLNGWLGMAKEFHDARKELLVASGKEGQNPADSQWGAWVARFQGFISRPTADRLADIGATERSEVEALRNTYFQKGTGIAAIAAYLSAPDPVKALARSDENLRSGAAIEEAVERFNDPAAEEFKKLTSELSKANAAREAAIAAEKKANAAVANVEQQIEIMRREIETQADLRVQDATARLQREIDEARHQAAMRQKDIEQANRDIQRAQSDWEQRQAQFQAQLTEATAKATQAERERAQRAYEEQMKGLQIKLEAKTREASESDHKLKIINDQITSARNAVSIRTRWDLLAGDLVARLDDAIGRLPTAVDAQYFERNEYVLADAVRKRAEQLAERMRELASAGISVVEAD